MWRVAAVSYGSIYNSVAESAGDVFVLRARADYISIGHKLPSLLLALRELIGRKSAESVGGVGAFDPLHIFVCGDRIVYELFALDLVVTGHDLIFTRMKYYNFCFDIINKNIIKDLIKFKF